MFIYTAYEYAAQSPCIKRQVGCVITKDGRIIAYGFNHGYIEVCNCNLTKGVKNPACLHAEEMALQGTCDIYIGAYLWVTYQPCIKCARLAVKKGISRVYFSQYADSPTTIEYLKQSNVEVIYVNPEGKPQVL